MASARVSAAEVGIAVKAATASVVFRSVYAAMPRRSWFSLVAVTGNCAKASL
jgi:hypothetical protein